MLEEEQGVQVAACRVGDKDLAKEALLEALSLDPENSEVNSRKRREKMRVQFQEEEGGGGRKEEMAGRTVYIVSPPGEGKARQLVGCRRLERSDAEGGAKVQRYCC